MTLRFVWARLYASVPSVPSSTGRIASKMPTRRLTTLLEEALDAWADARHGVIAELDNIPAARLASSPAPGARSGVELVQHIIESALMWTGELTNPAGDFTRQNFPGFIEEYASRVARYRTKAVLRRQLTETHTKGERQIRTAGELGMLQRIRRFDGKWGTRLTWMHHGIAHEEYHRAQLALYARLWGRTPALTKLIHGTS